MKAVHPDLPVGVSFFSVPFFPQWTGEDDYDAQVAALADLTSSTDFTAFSLHPFMSGLLAEDFPENYLSILFSLTDKPVAVSESSYPAEVWETTVDGSVLLFNGSEEKQERFLDLLLREAQRQEALFVIWFTIRDFDALWEGALGQDSLSLT